MKISFVVSALLVAILKLAEVDSLAVPLIFLPTFNTEGSEIQKIIDCRVQTNVDPLHAVIFERDGEIIDDQKLKCYVKCTLVKLGVLKENGTLNEERILKNGRLLDDGIHSEDFQKLVEACKNVKGREECDTAGKVAQCITRHVNSN